MGMPTINIAFKERAKTVVKRSARGVVGLILKEADPGENPVIEMTSADDIPKDLTEKNRAEIARTFIGNVNPPIKVITYVLPEDDAELEMALEYFESSRVNYLAMPELDGEGGDAAQLKEWLSTVRNEGSTIKLVLPNIEGDHEGIINYATNSIITETEEFDAAGFCGRIAGICAGTPITQGVTYATIPEALNCERLSKSAENEAVDSGKLIAFYDGEKVKLSRGVTSFSTITPEKGKQFKKIKIVDVMDTIKLDLTLCIRDEYIGKYINSYDNKCLLISCINGYLKELEQQQVIQVESVDIDLEATKAFLKEKGIDTSEMKPEEIKKADTDEEVFLAIRIKILDVMEDVTINVEV